MFSQPILYILFTISTYVSVLCIPLNVDNRPVVDVPNQGRVIGIQINTKENFTYYAFRGIPYGQPPIGNLRFRDPIASDGWSGDLDGAELPSECTQISDFPSGDEDCLYLGVYTPTEALEPLGEAFPVMIYIHGGGFNFGSMKEADTCQHLLKKDVIVVNIQYRLGVLGFLSTEDDSAPGNLGLKDQTLALKWVKDNIAAFGGDTNRIVIFGESAGSYSTHYQLLAPSASGLFSGAIMQSGTTLCPRAHGRNFLEIAQSVGRVFDCPEMPSDMLVNCLRNQSAQDLTAMNDAFFEWREHPLVFAPRVDGVYLPDYPLTLLKEKRYNKVPVIIGTVKDEGAHFSIGYYANPDLIPSFVEDFDKNGPSSVELLPEEDPLNTAQSIYDHYLPGLVIGEEQADNLTSLHGHRLYQIGIDWAIQQISPEVDVFMYELHHRGQFGEMDFYPELLESMPQIANWVSHADDLQYLFEDERRPLQTEEDLQVREVFVTTWTNFAKYLNPTPNDDLGYKWTKVSEGAGLQHLTIIPSPLMEEDYRISHREQLWNKLPLNDNPYS